MASSDGLDTPSRAQKFRVSVGLSGLNRQIFKKAIKKGYEFNLMVCGEKNLGKSTMLQMLFEIDDATPTTSSASPDPTKASEEEVTDSKSKSTSNLSVRSLEITEHGINLKLNLIDTPGYGDHIDNRLSYQPLENYINNSFRSYMHDESRADRQQIVDTRVHCLLYFINPSSHGLRPVDVITMLKLHKKVNIVPVIAKADMLTPKELKTLKQKIREDIKNEGITIFIPGTDAKDDRDNERMMSAIPFALVGSNTCYDVDGSLVRGRKYPWGVVEVDNKAHCDFGLLKKMLVKSHLTDLKGMTEEVLYEQFRADMLKKTEKANPDKKHGVAEEKTDTQELTKQHEHMKRDLEEQSRLLAEQRRQLEEDRKKFEMAAESLAK